MRKICEYVQCCFNFLMTRCIHAYVHTCISSSICECMYIYMFMLYLDARLNRVQSKANLTL